MRIVQYRDAGKGGVGVAVRRGKDLVAVDTAGAGLPPNLQEILAHGAPAFEALGSLVGRGRHIPAQSALDWIAGYACFNEASIRDYQFKTPQWAVGKNFDDTGAFGPEFVTADELPPGASGLRIETRLNGETVQSSNTGNLLFDVAAIVSILSEAFTFEPGDLIATGTPEGVGLFRKPPLFMKHGDCVEVEIEGIGILENPVRDEVRR
jgi:2-keto-4-pentenoate hydratase/2-oxohepta-3-ene-1,7-dioic acid hydratase in catechol pathway